MMTTRTRGRARSASPSSPVRQNRAECLLLEKHLQDAVGRAEEAEERTARAEIQLTKTITGVRQQLQQEFKDELQDIAAEMKQLQGRLAQTEQREREAKGRAENAEKREREAEARSDEAYNTQQEARIVAERAESREKITREREARVLAELEKANKRAQEAEMREEEANARIRATPNISASVTNHANGRPTDLRSPWSMSIDSESDDHPMRFCPSWNREGLA